jgi:hypothetical protein
MATVSECKVSAILRSWHCPLAHPPLRHQLDHALNLMSLAIANNAFAFLAVHDAFWERGGGSQQRGVPFVLVHKLCFSRAAKCLSAETPRM